MCFQAGCSKDLNNRELLFEQISKENINAIHKILLNNPSLVHSVDISGQTPLHVAAAVAGADTIELLLKFGADVNVKDNSLSTPLHAAAFHNDVEILKLLLNKGASTSINDVNKFGQTPLDQAYDAHKKMLRIRTINPDSIKNYKPQTEEEKKADEKRYLDRIDYLKKNGAKTAEELLSAPEGSSDAEAESN